MLVRDLLAAKSSVTYFSAVPGAARRTSAVARLRQSSRSLSKRSPAGKSERDRWSDGSFTTWLSQPELGGDCDSVASALSRVSFLEDFPF